MTEKESRQAASALARWFKSQEISMSESTGVMMILLGGILAETCANDFELVGAMAAFSSDLADAIKAQRPHSKKRSRG